MGALPYCMLLSFLLRASQIWQTTTSVVGYTLCFWPPGSRSKLIGKDEFKRSSSDFQFMIISCCFYEFSNFSQSNDQFPKIFKNSTYCFAWPSSTSKVTTVRRTGGKFRRPPFSLPPPLPAYFSHGAIQRWDLFFANLVKQDPGRARPNSWARAGWHFTQPRTKNKSHLCIQSQKLLAKGGLKGRCSFVFSSLHLSTLGLRKGLEGLHIPARAAWRRNTQPFQTPSGT